MNATNQHSGRNWARQLSDSLPLIIGVSFGTIVFLTIGWTATWLWETAGEHDRNPPRGSVPQQLMNRKSSAMEDIFAEMIRGDLRRVNVAAKRMEACGDTMDWYLSHSKYDEHGEQFRNSVHALKDASERKDMEGAKEAVLDLERSCIECHIVLNRQKAGTQ